MVMLATQGGLKHRITVFQLDKLKNIKMGLQIEWPGATARGLSTNSKLVLG